MGVKTHAIASFTMASILAISMGLANFASAAQDEDGNYIPMPEATCAELQNAINNTPVNDYDGFTSIRLAENCSANLVIPSGKKIKLELWPYDLTDNGGDTITVEENAVFHYDGSNWSETDRSSIISNTTNGKAVINNRGLVRIYDASIKAENGAYTIINSGELNVLGDGVLNDGIHTGTKISNTGKMRIAGGVFDNIDEIRPYVINGGKIDETTGKVYVFSEGEKREIGMPNGIFFPVGYTFTVKMTYPDYFDALNFRFESNGVAEIVGSNQEGWTFTITDVGEFYYGRKWELFGKNWGYGEGPKYGYKVPSSIQDKTKDLLNKLVNKLFDVVQKAIEDGKTISLDLEIDNKADVASQEKVEVAKVTGEDQIIGYYDVELALKGDGEKLTNITDLEGEEMEVRLPADFVDDLEKVADGYTRNYYIVRLHDGVAEKINAKLEGKELVFKSGKFSTYAVAYADTKTSDIPTEDDNESDLDNTNKGNSNSNTNTKTPDTPNTGMLAYITSDGAKVTVLGVLVAAVVSGLVASAVIIRKRQKNNK